MRPATPASYAAVLLVVVVAVLVALRVAFLASGQAPDETLLVAFQATITTVVGALLYMVHRNGSPR